MQKQLDKAGLRAEQVRVLYGNMTASVLGTIMVACLISMITVIEEEINIFAWVTIIIGIAILRGLDARAYRRANPETLDHKQYLIRFAFGSTLASASWGLLVWEIFPVSSPEYRAVVVFILTGITSFGTMTLSYHFGIISSYLFVATLPLAIRIYQDDSRFQAVFLTLVPLFLAFQLLGSRRVNRNYIENILLRHEANQKEIELRNQQYALDQHAIVTTANMRGEITHANDKFLEVSGYKRDEVLGQNHRLVSSQFHSREFFQDMWRTIARGHVWHGEIKNKTQDGSYYWVDSTIVPFLNAQGKPYQYISMRTDITPLKSLQKSMTNDRNDALVRAQVAQILQEQSNLEIRLREALASIASIDDVKEAAKIGLYLIDENTQELTLSVTYGDFPADGDAATSCETLQRYIHEATSNSKELDIKKQCLYVQMSDRNMVHGHYVVPLFRQDHVLGLLFIFTSPSPSQDQSRLDTLNFIGDMISLAIANEHLKTDMEQARENAEAMAQAKSDFLANMSHEIRTPMNGVLGMLDLLSDMPLDSKSKNFVDVAQNSAEMLLTVINDILDLSKIESGKLKIENIQFDLKKSVEDAAVLLSKQAMQKGLELSCFIDPGLHSSLQGDSMRLQQILTNLISNAIKFTDEGEVAIAVNSLRENDGQSLIRLEVHDTGIGITQQNQTTLFDAFTQADTSTSRKYGGTGLGLAISKHLAEMMGGNIGVESKKGSGSTFWVEIPFRKIGSSDVQENTLAQHHALVIDKHITQRRILQSYLDFWGVKNQLCSSPEAAFIALKEAAKTGRPFDTFIIDTTMPEWNFAYLALLKEDKKLSSPLSFILMTDMESSLEKITQKEELKPLVNCPVLAKPVRQKDLLDAIHASQSMRMPEAHRKQKTEMKKIKARVLFVDDNMINQQVGREMLALFGISPVLAGNGEEAVNHITSIHDPNEAFDIIFMDCQMPVMDGFTASMKIRGWENAQKKPHTVIIALTANAMEGDREKCLAAGMHDYIAKPYTLAKLEEKIHFWLNQTPSRTLVQTPPQTLNPYASPTPKNKQPEPSNSDKEIDPLVDIIDVERFTEMCDMMGDQTDDIVKAFFTTAETAINEMESHLANDDFDALRSTIHSLKGSCGTLGIARLFKACKEAEECCRTGNTENMHDNIKNIIHLLEQSNTAIEAQMGVHE